MRLRGRLALVTGASRGIGRAVALLLAAEGARVHALARSADALADLARTAAATDGDSPASELGGSIDPVVCDLTDDTSVWSTLDELTEAAGRPPDIVVNAAGAFGIAPLTEETVKSFDAQLAVNLRAPFLVIRTLLPAMIQRGEGTIVNIGSVAGRKAFPENGAYSASKFGLRGLHEVLVEELRGSGVRATLVEPAATDTGLWDPLDPDENPDLPDRDEMLAVDDVAQAVLFAVTRPSGVTLPSLRVERG